MASRGGEGGGGGGGGSGGGGGRLGCGTDRGHGVNWGVFGGRGQGKVQEVTRVPGIISIGHERAKATC